MSKIIDGRTLKFINCDYEKREIIVSGFICKDDSGDVNDGIYIYEEKEYFYKLFKPCMDIESIFEKIGEIIEEIEYNEPNEGYVGCVSFKTKNEIKFSYFITDRKISYNEANELMLIKIIRGVIDCEIEDNGYSEWTITGYDFNKLTVGGHDIKQELLSNIGKYINIKIEY